MRNTWKVSKCWAGKGWRKSDESCEKWIHVKKGQGGEEYRTNNKNKEDQLNWSYLAYEQPFKTCYWRKGEGRILVMGRQRCLQILDNLKENRGYSKLNEETLHCTLWKACFGKGYGSTARQTTELLEKELLPALYRL